MILNFLRRKKTINMVLIFLGQLKDASDRICFESEPYGKFGFDVRITYKEGTMYHGPAPFKIYNFNMVHHLWSKNYMGGPSIAFESDNFHKTGFTRRVDEVESVVITISKELKNKPY